MLFVPAESFLAVALETDPGLIEYAASRQVVLATPTTLIALLRTVAHGWRHEALADQAREIHRLGRDLHERLGTPERPPRPGRPLAQRRGRPLQPGGRLLESRVLVSARRFADLSVVTDDLDPPRQVESTPGRPASVEPAVELRAVDRRAASGEDVTAPYAWTAVTQARTLWEEGREPGRQVVALGVAVALTAVDRRPRAGRAGRPLLRPVLRRAVRRARAGGAARPTSSSSACCRRCSWSACSRCSGSPGPTCSRHPQDGVVQAVVTGLSHHSGALVAGYVAVPGHPRGPAADAGRAGDRA